MALGGTDTMDYSFLAYLAAVLMSITALLQLLKAALKLTAVRTQVPAMAVLKTATAERHRRRGFHT
jgi:hypothetical protein